MIRSRFNTGRLLQLSNQFPAGLSAVPNLSMPPSSAPTSIHISPFRWHWASFSTLPKLPVPPLKQTMSRFLQVAKPIVSEEEYKETERLVSEFSKSGSVGEKLQALLEKRATVTENWLADWWLEKAYLDIRDPLPIVTSPGLSFPLQTFAGVDDQVEWAAKLISALLKYEHMCDTQSVPPDMAGAQAMDMSQYDLLFGTNRVPGVKRDTMRYGCKEPVKAKHIVVARRGNFFSLPVWSSSGQQYNSAQIVEALRRVVHMSASENQHSIGLMTTQPRTQWGTMHDKLKKNPSNARNMDLLETSIFVICLDKPVLRNVQNQDWSSLMTENCAQCLHGGGSHLNSNNRWFDKTLQFIVGEDGACGMTYEHSPAEGPPVASLMEYAMDHITDPALPPVPGESPTPQLLEFDFDNDDKKNIEQASKEFDQMLHDVELQVLQFNDFGKDFPKSQKMSPDSFLQIAYQLAFYRVHGEHPPTYETGTLRKFKLGRTDTIRLPSTASAHFVETMVNRAPGVNDAQLADLCRRAIASHRDYMAAACSGNGIDRHLLGLQILASENGLSKPKLFDGTAYQTAMHYKLSTSQVPTKHDCCMAFGPMYPDCYGICYNPQEHKINIAVSSFHHFPETSAPRFAQQISKSLLDMRDLLLKGQKSKM